MNFKLNIWMKALKFFSEFKQALNEEELNLIKKIFADCSKLLEDFDIEIVRDIIRKEKDVLGSKINHRREDAKRTERLS